MLSFLVMIVIISGIACHFAYEQKRVELLAGFDKKLLQIANEYMDIRDEFWELYLPIFEGEGYATILKNYFSKGELSSIDEFELSEVLSHMAAREDKVQWIAVYSPDREINYIYLAGENKLQRLQDDFAWEQELIKNTGLMEVLESREQWIEGKVYRNIVLKGGVPGKNVAGGVVVGYDVSRLERLCEEETIFSSLQFYICEGENTIYSSADATDFPVELFQLKKGGVYEIEGKKWYVYATDEHMRGEVIFYALEWRELFWSTSRSVCMIVLLALFMTILSTTLCLLAIRSIIKEVNIIRCGLKLLGENRLNYRIKGTFAQPEFAVIADAVNTMAQKLKENIERTHEYEQRQIKSELQELQAKFNPHFLYNTLDLFRCRCYQNGDEETAELIAQTAAIFRGFIGSKTFIPIQEELAFCGRYLSLFQARYGDSVKILYDIDSEVLSYGIIRNVFQPLIENYFEHGYDASSGDNYIRIEGHIRDEDTIFFRVEDNGIGMDETAMKELNSQLDKPIVSERECYGLRNLHQRLQLFYGDGFGLSLRKESHRGIIIEILVKRKKVEDIES